MLLLFFFYVNYTHHPFSQHTSDTMDVDNEADYKEMVKKIHQGNPSSTKILVNMKVIEKFPILGRNMEDNDNETTDGDNNKVHSHSCRYLSALFRSQMWLGT